MGMIQRVGVNANSSLIYERPDLFNATIEGVSDVIRLQGNQPVIYSGTRQATEVIDEVEANSFDNNRNQIQLECMVDNLLIANPNLAADYPEYIITDRDLYGEGLTFALGYTLSETGLSIQSIARILAVRDINGEAASPYNQAVTVRHIARHEFGHMMGMLKPQDYSNPDLRDGLLYSGHCNNICTMKQADSAEDMFEIAEYIHYNHLGMAGFCASCVANLRSKNRLR